MYKVLIVDDEKMIRMGIKKVIPWESIGIDEVFTCSSAKEALEILNGANIDVMITDINMTEMTGIELIQKARESSFDIRIIVLTGYDEFEYARQCLRLRVEDFFLKPIDEIVLTNTIKKQVDFLEKRKQEENLQISKTRIQGTAEQLELEKIMRKFVHNNISHEEEKAFYLKYGYESDKVLQVAIIIPKLYMDLDQGEENFITMSVKNICISMIDAQNLGITFMDDDSKIVMVLFNNSQSDEIVERMDQLNDILKDEYSVKPKIVIGSQVKGFLNLMISYNDGLHLMENEKENINEIVQSYQSQQRSTIFMEIYQELKRIMNTNVANIECVLKSFDTFCKAAESYNLTTNYVRQCCFDIASSVCFSYVSNSGDKADGKISELLKSIISASHEEACEVTRMFLSQLLGEEETNSHEIVSQAKRYIHECLAEELSVSSISASLYITPNYFSRLFKRVTGEGCNEYIVRKRIEKAKFLLETTNIKSGKIASMVGYNDTNYFSLAFKKHTGMSPTKYRDRIRESG